MRAKRVPSSVDLEQAMSSRSSNVPRRGGRAVFAVALTVALVLGAAGVAVSGDVPIATVNVGMSPAAVAVNPLSHTVYVANYYGNTVSVIDGATDSNEATIPMPFGYAIGAVPLAVVVDPLATPARAYVANWQSHIVSIIDESSLAAIATITVPASEGAGNPRALALWPTSTPPKLYVANYHRDSVSVLNAETGVSITEIPVGASPRALAIFTSAGRKRLYVANRFSNDVSIIDMETDSVVATVPTGAGPKAIAVDQASGQAFVTSPASDTVTVIDDSDAVTATVAVGDNPLGIDIDQTGGRAFVADYASNDVAVIDTASHALVTTIAVAAQPWAVAVDQGDRKAFVGNYGAAQVTVIDRDLAVTTCAVGANPYAIVVDEGTVPHKAYVANWGDDTVTVVDEPLSVGFFGATEAMADDATGAVSAHIVPFTDDATTDPTPLFTGVASSTRAPYRTDIAAVFVRLDGTGPLYRAQITSGAGTPDVEWSLEVTAALEPGAHTIGVLVYDDASVTSVSSGLDQAGRSAYPAGDVAYAFDINEVAARYEQTDSRLHREGVWKSTTSALLSGGSDTWTNSSGGAMNVAFDGTAVTWVSTKAPFYGRARAILDGSTETTVDLYAPGVSYQQPVFSASGLAPGPHTLRIEWTGDKTPAASSAMVRVDAVEVIGTLTQALSPRVRYEQTDSRLHREGVWKSTTSALLSGGSDTWTNSSGGAMNVAFDGTAVTWVSTKAPFYGRARAILDGSTETTVDLYAPGVSYQQPVFSASGLAPGPHTLRIEWTGDKTPAASSAMVRVDAVEVIGTLTQAP